MSNPKKHHKKIIVICWSFCFINIEEIYFIKKEMPRETYDKFLFKYQSEKNNIIKQMESYQGKISNLENYINNALTLSSKLSVVWSSSPVGIKEKFQKLIFLEGIYYNKKNGAFRIEKLNSIFAAIAAAAKHTTENKKGTNHSFDDLSLKAGASLQVSNNFTKDLMAINEFCTLLGDLV